MGGGGKGKELKELGLKLINAGCLPPPPIKNSESAPDLDCQ